MKKKILANILILALALTACSNASTEPAGEEQLEKLNPPSAEPDATATPEATPAATPEATAEPTEDAGFKDPIEFTVKDGDGNPVPGVYIQICTGDLCNSITTNAEGKAEFTGDADEYEAKIYKAPQGLTFSSDEQVVRPGDKIELAVSNGDLPEPTQEAVDTDDPEGVDLSADIDEKYKIEFNSSDYIGSAVTSDIFKEYKLTFINRWEPWCGPCVSEMADIQALYEKYEPLGVNFIGVYSDEDGFEEVLKETGAEYRMIKDCAGFSLISNVGYVPVTCIVDSEGHMLPMRELADSLTGEFDPDDARYERTHIGSVPGEAYEAVIKYYLGM